MRWCEAALIAASCPCDALDALLKSYRVWALMQAACQKLWCCQIRLLANVLEFAGEPQRSVWTRELLSLLFPLAQRSRLARLQSCFLASHIRKCSSAGPQHKVMKQRSVLECSGRAGGASAGERAGGADLPAADCVRSAVPVTGCAASCAVTNKPAQCAHCTLLQNPCAGFTANRCLGRGSSTCAPCAESCVTPIAGMDLLEEVLSSGDKRRIGRAAAREGALAALARTLHMRGLGGKAAPLLAALAADGTLLAALRALLGPGDYAVLAVRSCLTGRISALVWTLCSGKHSESVSLDCHILHHGTPQAVPCRAGTAGTGSRPTRHVSGCLVCGRQAIALAEARAGDAAGGAAGLLGALLAGVDAHALHSLALGRCLGSCLAALPLQAPGLTATAASDAGA